jgi:RNA polymerase sigma-70 factor (ECF subfamily)
LAARTDPPNPELVDGCFNRPFIQPSNHSGRLLALAAKKGLADSRAMERTEAELIAAVLKGDCASFEPLVRKYSPRVFATARRYARRESEVEDIAQEVWLKAFEKLNSFRGEAPFEHWLMRLAVRTCYDFLRGHQRNRESSFSDLSEPESDWLERFVTAPETASENADAAKTLIGRVLERLSPPARLVITLLEIEDRSVKEIAALTGWSVPLVKVRAFRARADMRKIIAKMAKEKYL